MLCIPPKDSAISTKPSVTVKSLLLKEAIPLLAELASAPDVAYSPVIVTTFPTPEVSMPSPPRISNSFPIGIAIPPSVIKLVGICG